MDEEPIAEALAAIAEASAADAAEFAALTAAEASVAALDAGGVTTTVVDGVVVVDVDAGGVTTVSSFFAQAANARAALTETNSIAFFILVSSLH